MSVVRGLHGIEMMTNKNVFSNKSEYLSLGGDVPHVQVKENALTKQFPTDDVQPRKLTKWVFCCVESEIVVQSTKFLRLNHEN